MSEKTCVKIVDIDIPFLSMVTFMVKWTLATIPAAIIIGILVVITVSFMKILLF